MEQNTEKKSSRRKIAAIIVTIIVVASMCIMGTYAFTPNNLVTKAVTLLTSGDTPTKQVVGHYDVHGDSHDVYVEYVSNSNTSIPEVYVRVKLSEALTIGTTTITNETSEGRTRLDQYRTLTMGNTTTKNYLKATSAQYNKTDEDAPKTLIAGVAKDNSGETYGTESNDIGTTAVCNSAPIAMQSFIDYYPYATAPVSAEMSNYIGWVEDTDGWYYWSQPLTTDNSKNTTGLLVDAVTMQSSISGQSYTYKMEVTFEAVDKTDLGVLISKETTLKEPGEVNGTVTSTLSKEEDITANGILLLKILSNTDQAKDIATGRYTSTSDGARQLYQQAYKALQKDYAAFDAYLGAVENQMTMAKLRVREAETAQQEYTNNPEYESENLFASNMGSFALMPDNLKQYLIKEYGSEESKSLTHDQAKAVTAIYLDCQSYDPATSDYPDLLASLDASEFPNLDILQLKNFEHANLLVTDSPTSERPLSVLKKLRVLDLHVEEEVSLDNTYQLRYLGYTPEDLNDCQLKVLILDGQTEFYSGISTSDYADQVNTASTLPMGLKVCSLANTGVSAFCPQESVQPFTLLEYLNLGNCEYLNQIGNQTFNSNVPLRYCNLYRLNHNSDMFVVDNFIPQNPQQSNTNISSLNPHLLYLNLTNTGLNTSLPLPSTDAYDFPTLNEGWLEGIALQGVIADKSTGKRKLETGYYNNN